MPGMLHFMGSQRVRHDLVVKQQERQRGFYEEGNMRSFLESFNQYSRGVA